MADIEQRKMQAESTVWRDTSVYFQSTTGSLEEPVICWGIFLAHDLTPVLQAAVIIAGDLPRRLFSLSNGNHVISTYPDGCAGAF